MIHATERGTPDGREPIRWKLVTNLPVACKADAIEKLNWYALRWKIEMFHKVMKSGCRVEDSRLQTAARLANLIAMMCIVAWRVLWLTLLNRRDPKLPATLVLTEVEISLLDRLLPSRQSNMVLLLQPFESTTTTTTYDNKYHLKVQENRIAYK